MRILVLHSELGVLRGGGENFTRNLFGAFHKRGHEIHAAFVADTNSRYPIPMPPGVEPIPVPGWWASELGQSTLSLVGSWVAPRGWMKSAWDHVQGAIDGTIGDFRNELSVSSFKSGVSMTWCTCITIVTWRAK
jgi:hypothetical protein